MHITGINNAVGEIPERQIRLGVRFAFYALPSALG